MTGVTFTAVDLDTRHGDQTGLLVFMEGRLAAVLCRLDADHGELTGRWFVEKTFREMPLPASNTFEQPDDFAAFLVAAARQA